MFGFINEMVEHEGIKVILVANEKEISTEITPERLEQQYMVALDEKIEWPKYEEKDSFLRNYREKKNNNKLSFDELNDRRNHLFPQAKSNGEYRKMREKLIGVTFRYEADMPQITRKLIEKVDANHVFSEAIERNLKYIEDTMCVYKHHNLRTFQFFLSKVSFLLEQVRSIDIDSDYTIKIDDYVIKACFKSATEFKSNYKIPKDNAVYGLKSAEEPTISTIHEYVNHGQFNIDSFKEEIKKIESEYMVQIDHSDPYSKLRNEYFYMTQKECEEKLQELIERLKDNKYPVTVYDSIAVLIIRMERIGFGETYGEQIKAAMIENVKQSGTVGQFRIDSYLFDDKEEFKKASDFMIDINEAMKTNYTNTRRKTINEVLESADWVAGLETYRKTYEQQYKYDWPIFSQADSKKWIEAIKNSSARTVHDFRSWIWDVFPQNEQVSRFKDDWKTMKEIHDAINLMEEDDVVKKWAFKLLVQQIEDIYESNMGEKYGKNDSDTSSKDIEAEKE